GLDEIGDEEGAEAVPAHVDHAAAPVTDAHVARDTEVDERVDASVRAEVEKLAAVVAVREDIGRMHLEVGMLAAPCLARLARRLRAALAEVPDRGGWRIEVDDG